MAERRARFAHLTARRSSFMTTSFFPSTADTSNPPDAPPLGEPTASESIAAPRQPTGADVRRVLATVAAVLAAGGGLVHLGVIGDHTEYGVVAGGFAAMGISQCVVAVWLLVRPSRRVFLLGAGLHAAIAATWALSRTVGLWFVPGEAQPSEVGVTDLVATTFSLGLIGVVVIVIALDRAASPTEVPRTVARRMVGTVAAGALFLTAIAVSAPHVHASDGPAVGVPAIGHSHDHGPALSTSGAVDRLGTAPG
jgi:hypothetical protein